MSKALAALAVICAALVIAGGFGPWFHFETPQPHTLYGAQTDGLVAIIAAVVAAITLVVALVRTRASVAAWTSLVAFVICALTGLVNWLALAPASSGTGVETRWGVAVVTLAGLAGTICAFIIACRLNRY